MRSLKTEDLTIRVMVKNHQNCPYPIVKFNKLIQ
jgi:hypothetical protein